MQYTDQNTAQTVFLTISDILLLWISRVREFFLKLFNIGKLSILYLAIFLLLICLIKNYLFKDKKKYILITHRNIQTKKICNILFFEIHKNNSRIDNYLSNFDLKIVRTDMLNLVFDKQNNIFFLHIIPYKQDILYNIAEIEIFKELLNILNNQETKNIDIFIYDTHDRYIDTFCMMFGEKSLITGNRVLLKNAHIFYSYLNNILIDFYSVDMILSNKNIISVLEMLRSLEEDNNALQKVYYHYNDTAFKLDKKGVIFYLFKIAKFINRVMYSL